MLKQSRRSPNAIEARVSMVCATHCQDFRDGAPAYDAASMAIIRLASLLERPVVAEAARLAMTEQERAAIRTTCSIAAHAGCRDVNDDLFWLAVTQRLPGILQRLSKALM